MTKTCIHCDESKTEHRTTLQLNRTDSRRSGQLDSRESHSEVLWECITCVRGAAELKLGLAVLRDQEHTTKICTHTFILKCFKVTAQKSILKLKLNKVN